MHYIILFFGVIFLLSFLSWRYPEQQKLRTRDRQAPGQGTRTGEDGSDPR